MEEDFIKKKNCNFFCNDSFLRGTKNYPLSKPMVDHNQKRVKANRGWKICDEVAGYLLERTSGNGADRSEWGNGGMHVGFILLGNSAPFNVLLDKGYKTWPPELRGNKLASL